MKTLDSTGLLFVFLAVLFVGATLFGHRERERFSNALNPWDTLVKEVETEYSKYYTFNLTKFREFAANQVAFFTFVANSDAFKGIFAAASAAFGAITPPLATEDTTAIKKYWKGKIDVDKPYDSRISILDAQYLYFVDELKKSPKFVMYTPQDIATAKATLKTLATKYLVVFGVLNTDVGAAQPADGKTSNSITSSFTNLFG
jgi:hypothetical protein